MVAIQEVKTMETENTKRLPGIPDRTLVHIAESVGGKIEKFLTNEGKANVRLIIDEKVFESDTNTRLLIQVLENVK